MTKRIPLIIAGGNGYVSGELLRLLAFHPSFEAVAVTSTTHAGEKLTSHFPQLSGVLPETFAFIPVSELPAVLARYASESVGLFLATPHGSTAALAAEFLNMAKQAGTTLKMVDLSADFRFEDTNRYASIYKAPHGAPEVQKLFQCGCPDLIPPGPSGKTAPSESRHYAHPGCFTTATVLAAAPFLAYDLVEEEIFVAAVTGSSGSGRKPIQGTHHPERNSNLLAYSPLTHRHEAEMRMLLGRVWGVSKPGAPPLNPLREPDVSFIPHSGPFSRGIHATLHLRLKKPVSADELVQKVNDYYAHTPFVRASLQPPKLIEVAGTNRCRIGISTRFKTLAVMSAIDNMVKGSAGGGVQWMNRLFNLPDETGLQVPGLGWY